MVFKITEKYICVCEVHIFTQAFPSGKIFSKVLIMIFHQAEGNSSQAMFIQKSISPAEWGGDYVNAHLAVYLGAAGYLLLFYFKRFDKFL